MSVAAVLLAAGRSTRFGAEDKIAAALGGLPLGHHAARTLNDVDLTARYVVCPPRTTVWPGFVIVTNDSLELGQSRSIALGVAAARGGGATAVLIALADMPFVPAIHFSRLIAGFHGPGSIVASSDGKRRMPPALFGAGWFGALIALSGDQGARALLDRAELVTALADDLSDIDHRADLAKAMARAGS